MSLTKYTQLSSDKKLAIELLERQLIDPSAEKMTYQQIADQVGIDVRQLYNWRTQDKEFREAREEFVDQFVRSELVSEAYRALRHQLTNRNSTKAAEIVLRSQSKWGERSALEVKAEVTNPADQSLDELEKELAQLRARNTQNRE